MWIRTTKENVKALHPPGTDYSVTFGADSTVAQTDKETGEYLIERYEFIVEHNAEDN